MEAEETVNTDGCQRQELGIFATYVFLYNLKVLPDELIGLFQKL